ncbi:uncharacterized protein LOC132712767 isoform X2 [Ruditapes philippinarum]|nr:uncharacterized protein LOC132712767 isoform X2 [Ruditapes philippinarum]XP_060551183.1 uncharacterized protein LOC132712767 isoform X2 [Ruditapes philippinarum]XP_060551184.1 uncharacterized protein LOC132712767 isoform X2 [Ruditapes philippinarum]XP_060551185.1 uncharacterized protein LOC132712767 isoform X2 [Ruditapes philippinarum]
MDLEYNINKNGKILVWIYSQTSPLGLHDLSEEEKKGSKTLMTEEATGCKRDIDLKQIRNFFENEKEGNFDAQIEVKQQIRTSFEEFKSELKKIDKENPLAYQCFVFVFLTYSKPQHEEYNEELLHFDHRFMAEGLVPQAKIIDEVKNLNVTKGKPKIFLIQADDLSLLKDKMTHKAKPDYETPKVIKIPTDADQLIIKSTIPQRIANKHAAKETPSFLIQAFLKAMKTKKEREDLLTLTTTINRHVADLITEYKNKSGDLRATDMHVPLVTSTLTKLLFL